MQKDGVNNGVKELTLATAEKYPGLPGKQVHEIVDREIPGCSYQGVWRVLKEAGLFVATPGGPKKGHLVEAPRVRPQPVRASVHGYHGRSRLLGSYEL